MIKLGAIGYGGRGSGVVSVMEQQPCGARLVAIADPNAEAVKRTLAKREKDPASVRLYADAQAMLDAEELDAVIVATRCSLHARLGAAVLARNLPLYLEKPVATTFDDYRLLAAAAAKSKSPTMVSFPLRLVPGVRRMWEIVRSGRLGEITHVQATNNVPYGEVYYQTWYRDQAETGGMFLQKATHDLDVISYLLGEADPVQVAAMTSKRVFRGDHPAGLKCVDCDEKFSCLESKHNPAAATGAPLQTAKEDYRCAFAVDTGNEDSGNAIIEYAGGTQGVYTQNFYSRRGSACRKWRCIGHLGTIEYDLATTTANLWMHHQPVHEVLDVRGEGGHGGGDAQLAINFLRMVRGQEESKSPLAAGLRSALTCLLARESAATRTFQSAADYTPASRA
ncbi:MAG: Inositol 2-dehydrogenase/D-chiro-inositol 3-dehydrogenase [Phycisphaerae bacterium]|nr:Inositol 2-dehydrogenase/D-chiro-inositol 3-dehydrogenase [Phycisphaerae bacterium]